MTLDRRDALKVAALGTLGLGAAPAAASVRPGQFLNPVLAGDRPDPAILKDGADYYLTFSSFDAYPGLTIWHSRDLVNWQPRGPALTRNIGSVWAVSLEKHAGRYFLYIPVKAEPNDVFVSWADHIDGPWSDPQSLGLHQHIDPCHAVAEDGSRWLFLSGGDRVRLSDDGLSVAGPVEHVYDPWHYPPEWDVEGFSPEGPKIHRRSEWFYLISAVGGTAGPPTGHMVIAARSRSLHGPWEQHPGGAHPFGARGVVVARACFAGRRAGRIMVGALPRLPRRVLDARAAMPARSGAVERRRLVPYDRRRPVAAFASPARGRGFAARPGAER
jgi:hypothetical protein